MIWGSHLGQFRSNEVFLKVIFMCICCCFVVNHNTVILCIIVHWQWITTLIGTHTPCEQTAKHHIVLSHWAFLNKSKQSINHMQFSVDIPLKLNINHIIFSIDIPLKLSTNHMHISIVTPLKLSTNHMYICFDIPFKLFANIGCLRPWYVLGACTVIIYIHWLHAKLYWTMAQYLVFDIQMLKHMIPHQ